MNMGYMSIFEQNLWDKNVVNMGKRGAKSFTARRFSYSYKQNLFSKSRINLQQSLAARFLIYVSIFF